MFAYGEVEGEFPRAARKFSILLYFALAFILGAEISRAFNGKGVKERKSPREGEILLLPSSRQGRRLLEAQGRVSPSAEVDKGFALDPCGSGGFPKENGGVQPPRQSRSLP